MRQLLDCPDRVSTSRAVSRSAVFASMLFTLLRGRPLYESVRSWVSMPPTNKQEGRRSSRFRSRPRSLSARPRWCTASTTPPLNWRPRSRSGSPVNNAESVHVEYFCPLRRQLTLRVPAVAVRLFLRAHPDVQGHSLNRAHVGSPHRGFVPTVRARGRREAARWRQGLGERCPRRHTIPPRRRRSVQSPRSSTASSIARWCKRSRPIR